MFLGNIIIYILYIVRKKIILLKLIWNNLLSGFWKMCWDLHVIIRLIFGYIMLCVLWVKWIIILWKWFFSFILWNAFLFFFTIMCGVWWKIYNIRNVIIIKQLPSHQLVLCESFFNIFFFLLLFLLKVVIVVVTLIIHIKPLI